MTAPDLVCFYCGRGEPPALHLHDGRVCHGGAFLDEEAFDLCPIDNDLEDDLPQGYGRCSKCLGAKPLATLSPAGSGESWEGLRCKARVACETENTYSQKLTMARWTRAEKENRPALLPLGAELTRIEAAAFWKVSTRTALTYIQAGIEDGSIKEGLPKQRLGPGRRELTYRRGKV